MPIKILTKHKRKYKVINKRRKAIAIYKDKTNKAKRQTSQTINRAIYLQKDLTNLNESKM
jgi:hypothetical protein